MFRAILINKLKIETFILLLNIYYKEVVVSLVYRIYISLVGDFIKE